MKTDIRIDWQSGMEITPQTFIDMENNISENRLLVRKMIAATNFGVIPRTKFLIAQEIVNNTLMIKQINCDILLPSGQVVVMENMDPMQLNIPQKEEQVLYLTVELGESIKAFDKDEIPHVANEIKMEFRSLSEIRAAVPLLKLMQVNGTWSVFEPYILPVMSVRSSVTLLEKLEELKQEVQKIIGHDHAMFLEDRVLIMILLEQLASFPVDDSSRELVMLCKRVASALGYSVYKQRPDLPAPNLMDIAPYLNAFKFFLSDVATAMNDLKATVVEVKEPEPEPEPEPPVEDVFCPII